MSVAYPVAIEQKLCRIRRRQCALTVARSVLLGAAALLATMLVAMTIDWCFTLFSSAVRTLLTVSALGAGVATLLVAAIGPIIAALGLRRAAGDVDLATPRLEERWTTVANFVESNHRPRSAIGKAMLQQVTSEAVAMERLVEPAHVATPRQLQRAALLLVGAAALVLAFLAVNWQHHRVLLQRFWSPLADITATRLECVSGDLVVPRGEPVELAVNMFGLPRNKATIALAPDGKENETAEMAPTDEQPAQFKYFVAALDSSFRYRVQAGDGRTGWHSVTAIDRPALAEVKMTLTAPEYADRPVYEKDYLPARVQAVQGSHLRLEMRPETKVKSFELVFGREGKNVVGQESEEAVDERLTLAADRAGWYRYEAILEEDVTITPELLSPHDLTNEDARKCRIRVIPDRPPIARVISPTEEMAVSLDEVVEVKFEAHDDHGITKAELIVYEESSVEGEAPTILSVEEIPLGDQENAPHVLATAELDLSKYDLREGSNISYAVRVTDNRIAMQQQDMGQEQGPSGQLHASDSATEAGNDDQVADVNADTSSQRNREPAASEGDERPDAETLAQNAESAESRSTASDSPAGDRPAGEMQKGSNSTTEGEPSVDELAKSNGVQGLSPERPSTDALAQADMPLHESDKPVNPRGEAEPSDGADVASPIRSPQPKAAAEQTDDKQPGTDRIAKSEVPQVSTDSSDPDNQSAASASTSTRDDTAQDTKAARISDKTASPADEASNSDSEIARATSPRNAADGETETETHTETDTKAIESTAMSELPANDEAEAQLANAKESESRSAESSTSSGAVARKDEDMPNEHQSMVSGDLASVNRRPNMTDDMRGQFTESNRLRLKIEEKLISAAEPGTDRETIQMVIRQRLEQIDRELQPAEEVLSPLVATASQSGIADPQIRELNSVDQRLLKVEEIIAELRNESKETPYAFVGLHMVEIGTAHIAPARDRIFALVRQPDVDTHSNVAEALHRVSRARELLAELLVRYERVLRDEGLADAIQETAKFYEVYVENLHRFLRAQSKPNPNPLQRKMAIVEVEQAYLDRLREVTEMRRDLMAEFARMLGDDPRLLSKYMDLIKRRQTSLRDRLTELHERQEVIATELSGWLRVDEVQREDVWMLAAEVRLQDVAPLAREVSQLEERMISQFPLSRELESRDSAAVLGAAKQLAVHARTGTAKARRLLRDPFDESVDLATDIDDLAYWLGELDAAIEQLASNNADEETTDYTDKRLAESRSLFERVAGWTEIASHLQGRRFHGLAKVDQQLLAGRTELLRMDMESVDQQLDTQFRGEVPESVSALASELKQLMETITFNQAAATFELESERLNEAESQQRLALEAFERAEDLFDQIRRTVIEELDQIDPQNPDIANLEDPTLDELLERLEREPNLNALLGLPNRPQNLRVMSDFFASSDGDVPVPEAMEQAAEQARKRAKEEAAQARRMRQDSDEDDDLTEQQWREVADAEEAQAKLQEKIDELKRRAADPQTEPEEAEKLRQMAEQLEQMRQQIAGHQIDKQQWEEMVRSDQMRAILRAAAQGEPLPDSQWNRLMSSLDEGLWQVQRRTPPEEYRQAIEQYQERIRKLISLETADSGP